MASDLDRKNSQASADSPRPLVQRVGAVLWPSFFAAGVATMVFFANIDPLDLASISFSDLDLSRELGYSIGFFMFWACTASSSLFTWLLLKPGNSRRGQGTSRADHRNPP
ncbi:MAG TPA: hypothetical protein PLQ74_06435 [Pseudomonadota bacterium]|nr:hypothetical protein [Xanthomonadales bacterium]HQW81487.1 hypothetical protein [Pseudomonadota bacterium]